MKSNPKFVVYGWNARGLSEKSRQQSLLAECRKYKVDVLLLQEHNIKTEHVEA